MSERPVLLVVDDDPAIHVLFRRPPGGVSSVVSAFTAEEALEVTARCRPDVILLDVRLPDASGLEVFRKIRESDRKIPVIFMTTSRASETAISAMQLGAFDYLIKPLDLDQVDDLVTRALEISRCMNVPVSVEPDGSQDEDVGSNGADQIIGRSPEMQRVYKDIGRVASQDVTVLIRGESGSGKELVARAVYQHSARSAAPFLALNCAALPETLLESELFGHEAGAFTGATVRRVGKFEQCDGGTLFLDEVGDMPMLLQAKLLRVLQDGTFQRVGGNETIQVDVRVIAATNRDLEAAIEEEEFRADLFYRLNVFAIEIPPLRERPSDIELLTQHLLGRAAKEFSRPSTQLGPGALERLVGFDWPGNVRQLESVLKRLVLSSSSGVILAEDVVSSLDRESGSARGRSEDADRWTLEREIEELAVEGSGHLHAEATEVFERFLLRLVLRRCQGNQSRAAKLLGITRGSVRTKVRALGIDVAEFLPESAAED